MPRRPRPLVDGGGYHRIARGNNRQGLFPDPADFARFLDGLARITARDPARLFHDCLMSNYIHLLAQCEDATGLPRVRKALLQGYGR